MDDNKLIDAFESALVDFCNKWGSKGLSNTAVYKSLLFVATVAFFHKMYEAETTSMVLVKK